LPVDGIVEAACKTLEDVPKETVRAEFDGMVLRLIFSGIISITADIPGYTKKIADKPEVFKVARLQALNMDMVPNMRYETVRLSDDQRVVLQYVNGENTRDEITEVVKGHIDKGEMTINADGKPLMPGTDDFEKLLPQYIDAQLAIFAGNALLEA
jgi:methyltransferase-like protein